MHVFALLAGVSACGHTRTGVLNGRWVAVGGPDGAFGRHRRAAHRRAPPRRERGASRLLRQRDARRRVRRTLRVNEPEAAGDCP